MSVVDFAEYMATFSCRVCGGEAHLAFDRAGYSRIVWRCGHDQTGDDEDESEDLITIARREGYQHGYADAAARCDNGWVYDHEKRDWVGKDEAE